MIAWLIKWKWIGDHAKVENDIAAIVNYRTSPDNVKSLVEQLYVNSLCLRDRLRYVKSKSSLVYKANSDINGTIICGDNPFLEARKVDILEVVECEQGKQSLVYNKHYAKKKKPQQ
ncbi:hypothetical protein Ga0466249_002271 [Sporomusaceae bacterium BoRhaA]|uniref:hypothetical protein n=1 Tax=Pelorhabdus rhamnosifermentans TaxID=2772457 RepID=UPI001C060BDF|nr:hypothetical protein [Pelorhabdus rhamnosifermentans]MBU2701157.1 hypothetical protein [Pelorhabdus rhamnosifermentans]